MRTFTIHISRLMFAAVALLLMTAMSTTAWGQASQENFDYSTGQLTSLSGGANVSGGVWVTNSGTTGTFLQVSSPGLSYTGYSSSGNKLDMLNGTAGGTEDSYRNFTVRTGTVYVSFLLNLSNVTTLLANTSTTGDYFAGLIENTSTSNFVGRISVRTGSVAGTWQIGVRHNSSNAAAAFYTTDLSTATTYLIVMKYEQPAGNTNNVASIFVNPTIGAAEPAANATQTSAMVTDPANCGRFFVREAANSPNSSIDGIRYGLSWNDVVGSVAAPTVATGASSGVTTSAATLAGTVTSNNASTTNSFQYGTTMSYGSSQAAVPSPADSGYYNYAISGSLSGLAGNTLYNYRATGTNSAGTTNGSNGTFTTLTNTPTANAASAIMTTQFDANWTAGSGGAPTSYELDVATDGAFTSPISGSPFTGITGTTYTVTGLTAATAYHYRVRAVGLANTSGNSGTTDVTTADPVPSAPNATAATSVGTTSFDANWDAATYATSYRLDVATDAGFTSFVAGYSDKTVAGLTDAVTGLTPNTMYHYRVRAVNGSGTSGNSNTIDVMTTCPTVTVAPPSLPNGQIGVFYTQTITASGGTGPYTFTIDSGSAAGLGLALDPGGVLSGIPFFAECDTFRVAATDANGCVGTQTYIICASSCPILLFFPPVLPNGQEGASYSETISASGGTGPYGFAVTAGTFPPGLLLASTGEISSSPTTAGVYNFTVTAHDTGTGCEQTYDYTLVVCGPIVLSSLSDGTVGTPYDETITVTSGGTAPYSYAHTAGTLPAGLSFETTGQLHGTPSADGVFGFTITVTDANGCTDTKVYSLTMSCPSVSVASYPDGAKGTAYSNTPGVTGGTGPYIFTQTGGTLPPPLVLDGDGKLHGTPNALGTYPFDFSVMDSYGCTSLHSDTVIIGCPTITVDNPAPNEVEGVTYSHTYTSSGGTAPYSYAITAGSLPTGLSMDPAGAISGAPTTVGTYTYTVTVTDNDGCTGTLDESVDITPCPTITLTPASMPNANQGAVYPAQTLGASGGTGSYTFAVTVGTLPAGLSLIGNSISGTASTGGSYTFTIEATDNTTNCKGTKSYTIVIIYPAVFKVKAGPSAEAGASVTAVDTLFWDDPATWVVVSGGSATGVPHSTDQVILDHTYRTTEYVVKTGNPAQTAVYDTAAQITVGYIGNTVPVTLMIPPNGPTSASGGPTNLRFGNGVAGDYDVIISEGGTIADNKVAFARSASFNSVNDSIWIRTGGRWYHQTKGFNTMLRIMSRRFDGDYGTVEFDIDGNVAGTFDISGGVNYYYPNVVLSNTHNAPTYFYFGLGGTTIKGNLTVNTGAKDSLFHLSGSAGPFLHYGNIVNNGIIEAPTGTGSPVVFAGSTPQTVSGANAMLLGAGMANLNPSGVTFSTNVNIVGGTMRTSGTFTYDSSGVGNNVNRTAVGTVNMGTSTMYLNPAGSVAEGTNVVQGKVSATRTVGTGLEQFGSIGFEVGPSAVGAGVTTVVRKTGSISTGNGHQSISRYYDVTPTTNSGLGATMGLGYTVPELNGIPEANLLTHKSVDGGTTWSGRTGSVSIPLSKVTTAGVNALQARWTLASSDAPLFITHTITMRKLADTDGDPSTKGDQSLKKWRMSLYADMVDPGTLVATGNPNSGILTTTNLQSGTYIAVEEDSLGWLHLGILNHGTTLGNTLKVTSARYDTFAVNDAQVSSVDTVDFINQKVGTITVYKFKDTDGLTGTIEGAKAWYLEIYKGSVALPNLVAFGNVSSLTATNLQAGTYIMTEADSGASWVRLNGNQTRFDTVVIAAGQIYADTFNNFRPNTIVINKYYDEDGDFSTTGDRVLKTWSLSLTGPNTALNNGGATSSVGSTNLGDGSYTASEADSAGTIHLGYIVNGVPTASGANSIPVAVVDGQSVTVDFVNAPPLYSQLFRTAKMMDWATATDKGGKLKAVKAKPDSVHFKLNLVTRTDTVILSFPQAVTARVYTAKNKAIQVTNWSALKKVTVDLGVLVNKGDTIQIEGTGFKGKAISLDYSWSSVIATKAKVLFKGKLAPGKIPLTAGDTIKLNQLLLPMPNLHNVGTELFTFKNAFTGEGGLLIGEVVPDSIKVLGWVLHKKYGDVLASLNKKFANYQNGAAHEFDTYINTHPVKGQLKNLPPDKYNSSLFGQAVALGMNLAASDFGQTPAGLGGLLIGYPATATGESDSGYVVDAVRDCYDTYIDGMSIRAFYNAFRKWMTHRGNTGWNGHSLAEIESHCTKADFRMLLLAVSSDINGAFAGPMDTSSWGGPGGFKVQLKGVKALIDVSYLHADPSGPIALPMVAVKNAGSGLPAEYELRQNYPNPFNPTTTIEFTIPEISIVTLKVYNMLGQEVATLVNHEMLEDGDQEVTFDASALSSGVYFYRLTTESVVVDQEEGEVSGKAFTTTKKMLLVK